jgi:hypothetical protein
VSGRRAPYTERGISRVPCSRCSAPSRHQWQVCANGNRWLGICWPCDVALNRIALEFMRVPDADRLLAAYVDAAKPSHPQVESDKSREHDPSFPSQCVLK